MPNQPEQRKSAHPKRTDELEKPTPGDDRQLKRQLLTFGGGVYRDQDMIGLGVFEETDLTNLTFIHCTFNGVSFFRSNLTGANFCRSMMAMAGLLQATGRDVNFNEIQATDIYCYAATLDRSTFNGASLVDADFSASSLVGVSFVGAVLHGAKFVGANLTGANLKDASLDGAKFTGARMPNGRLFSEDRPLQAQLSMPRRKAA